MKEIKAFVCGYCKKLYRSEKACVKHENLCNKNEENIPICYKCAHLGKKEIWIDDYYDSERDEVIRHPFSSFYCEKLKIALFPIIVEKKGNQEEGIDSYVMKKECSSFFSIEDYTKNLAIDAKLLCMEFK